MTVANSALANSEAFKQAEQTSIVRSRRLPVPRSQLEAAGWTEGQAVVAEHHNGTLVIKTEGAGRQHKLSRTGIVGPAETFGFRAGQVVSWARKQDGIHVSPIDGQRHESYERPIPDNLGFSIPPSWLCQAFTGEPDSMGYLRSGLQAAQTIGDLVAEAGCEIGGFKNILDFGCGAGRVLRFVARKTTVDLVGYDLHAPSIDWCRAHMPFGRWEHGLQTPPLPEQEDSFDLIYAISVLTHLDEHHQDLWLSEWKRLLKPGGLLIATYRSEQFLEQFIDPRAVDYKRRVREGLQAGNGFTYIADGGWSGIFPEYYNDAYHSTAYVQEYWGEYFEVIRLYPAGTLAHRQDTALLRKPKTGPG